MAPANTAREWLAGCKDGATVGRECILKCRKEVPSREWLSRVVDAGERAYTLLKDTQSVAELASEERVA